jgi:4-alpha-glucanotransferase
MSGSRVSGVLLHPTSLPSRYGIGDLGTEAYQFIDFLHNTQQQLWQILPLGPTGYGNSPYMCYSALAGNPLLISLDRLRDDGFLAAADLAQYPTLSPDQVDFDAVVAPKTALLEKACRNFQQTAAIAQKTAFESFCREKADWLDDYSLFMALKDALEGQSWFTWPTGLAKRYPDVLQKWRTRLTPEIYFHQFVQFVFFQQWTALKQYANQKGVKIIGDIPIYVSHDSADVWSQPQNFQLDEDGLLPTFVAGVPPDFFSETGQLWGNPVYDWDYHQSTHFAWWMKRFQALLAYVDWIRIDHFRGFEAFWAVPYGDETAINGDWVTAPGTEFFEHLKQELGELPILAEDLGVITPEVEALRDRFAFPGMKILHFAFDSGPGNPYLPFSFPQNCLVYTGTHDNNTTVGWFNGLTPEAQDHIEDYLGRLSSAGIHWDLIRLALSSIAELAIIPMQDILGLDENARMNLPGLATGNWGWRYQSQAITSTVCDRLRTLTQLYGRSPKATQPKVPVA